MQACTAAQLIGPFEVPTPRERLCGRCLRRMCTSLAARRVGLGWVGDPVFGAVAVCCAAAESQCIH